MNEQITIPFKREMKKAVLEGRKFCTSRRIIYGEIGDYFILEGRKFVLTDVIKMNMGKIVKNFWNAEGFNSSEELKNYMVNVIGWRYNEKKLLFVHWFQEDGECCWI